MLWSLAEAPVSLDELRETLDEEPESAPGRRFAAWVSDAASERFGEISVWESVDDSELAGPGRARELIGRDPDLWEQFDLETWTG